MQSQLKRPRRGRPRNSHHLIKPLYEQAAGEGLTVRQAAERFGVSVSTVYANTARYGVKLRRGYESRYIPNLGRAGEMAEMYKDGLTLEEIGRSYGLTRERVRQIIKRFHGLTGKDGGASTRVHDRMARNAMKREAREAASLAKHGATLNELRGLRMLSRHMMQRGVSRERTPIGAFIGQRNNMSSNGIVWELRLWEWWQIWLKSGLWAQRGIGRNKYGLIRIDQAKGFVKGNVRVATHGDGWGLVSLVKGGKSESIRETPNTASIAKFS